ncbi:MAG: AI-2E family transporter, partial [Pseudomonadota bacterium]
DGAIDDITRLIRTYISMKTLINLSVATISFVIMMILGTDFAGFWALLIFVFGYVPIVGAVVAVSLPVILTLRATDGGLGKAVLTLILLTGAEQSISSFVEPRVMGKSLNLSPLVILISLATWGSIWGFAGMLLSVPLTVVVLITLSQFETTRPIAILLSDNGEIAPMRGTAKTAG